MGFAGRIRLQDALFRPGAFRLDLSWSWQPGFIFLCNLGRDLLDRLAFQHVLEQENNTGTFSVSITTTFLIVISPPPVAWAAALPLISALPGLSLLLLYRDDIHDNSFITACLSLARPVPAGSGLRRGERIRSRVEQAGKFRLASPAGPGCNW